MDENQDSINNCLRSLSSEMECGILSNKSGGIVVFYDQPLRSDIQWVEFDQNKEVFSLIHEDGSIQNLGLPFDNKMKKNLQHGEEVILAYISNGEFKRTYKTTLVIQDY